WLSFKPALTYLPDYDGQAFWDNSSGTGIWQIRRNGMIGTTNPFPNYLDQTKPLFRAQRVFYPVPADLTSITDLRFDASANVMYLLGRGPEHKLAAYPNWLATGSMTSPPSPPPAQPNLAARFVRVLPTADQSNDFMYAGNSIGGETSGAFDYK